MLAERYVAIGSCPSETPVIQDGVGIWSRDLGGDSQFGEHDVSRAIGCQCRVFLKDFGDSFEGVEDDVRFEWG